MTISIVIQSKNIFTTTIILFNYGINRLRLIKFYLSIQFNGFNLIFNISYDIHVIFNAQLYTVIEIL